MEGRCRNHPDHRQSKGVCPFCLRERLSQILGSSTASSMLTSPRYSSDSVFDDSSSAASPATKSRRRRGRSQKTTTKNGGLVAGGLLKKSRSMACGFGMTSSVAMEEEGVRDDGSDSSKVRKEKNKRGGFWYRLLGISRINKKKKKINGKDVVVVMDQGVLLHSNTVKENTSTSYGWTF